MNTLLHLLRFVIGIDEQQSQLTAAEAELLLRHVEAAKNFVEIGCFEGKTACAVARRGVRVYSIDPFTPGRLGICYGEWIARIQRHRDNSRNLTLIRGKSWDVAPAFDREIDVLFIDADHRYEAIQRDWQQWSQKVKLGGIIALHDCRVVPSSPQTLGTQQFYETDIPKMRGVREIAAVDSLAILRVIERTERRFGEGRT
jgi:predicted O-methyltransferase YrrM